MSASFFAEFAPRMTKLERTRRNAHYARRLAAVLGNGDEWEYRGECMVLDRPTGRCACGHEGLRYLFRLHHKSGRTCIVGSTCVGTYRGISPALVSRLTAEVARLEAADRLRAARAREAALAGPPTLF